MKESIFKMKSKQRFCLYLPALFDLAFGQYVLAAVCHSVTPIDKARDEYSSELFVGFVDWCTYWIQISMIQLWKLFWICYLSWDCHLNVSCNFKDFFFYFTQWNFCEWQSHEHYTTCHRWSMLHFDKNVIVVKYTKCDTQNVTNKMWQTKCDPHRVTHTVWPTQCSPDRKATQPWKTLLWKHAWMHNLKT